jgi:valyl-tRNA synthetase
MPERIKSEKLAKAFNPKEFEDRLYDYWLENNLFSPKETGEKYVIVIPPPNVTGVLHMGHGLNNSLQDILIRYYRMLGQSTLWLPGTDHAGIATQNVVDKKIKAMGLSREDLGREKFLEETWKVKEEHQGIIRRQLQKMGASCDWSRERFTLDKGLSEAVREVFVSLYEKDLLYRGNYLVNWCSSCGTAISDDEVEHQEVNGKLYYYNYPLVDGSGVLPIATTRPETMLGDTAVAVHPEDKRYKHYIGKMVHLPLTGRQIPVVADDFVSRDFGTGVVKVTPAHDLNDYEIGLRHNLKKINILNPDGTLSREVPERYRGLPVLKARNMVLEDLKEQNLFLKEEDYKHQVGHCYRCNTVIEPFLSSQWFVRMKPLAEKALKAWKQGKVRFFPKKWENTYTHWLENIRDWCISRQLWWGHRIPVWYCDDCGKMTVVREDPHKCAHCNSTRIHQDSDVLDTWFSSWLWPFSTLGWPEDTEDLKKYYPTSTLVTAYDIIFFWVARMIMAGMEFLNAEPFKDVYIHGLIRDKLGRKMSKSLGNGIDPLEIIDEYGADAFKFTLAFLAAQGQDILLDRETFKLGSRFANKIWNAARFILMNADKCKVLDLSTVRLSNMDRWIYYRLNLAVQDVRKAFTSYRFNDAAQAVYEFFWNDFCDWYIEASKLSLYSDDEMERSRIFTLLINILDESLRLIHPFLSFITEEIYQKLLLIKDGQAGQDGQKSIVIASYPEVKQERENVKIADEFQIVQELTRAIRTLRSEFTITSDRKIKVAVKCHSKEILQLLDSYKDVIRLLVGAGTINLSLTDVERGGSIPIARTEFEAFVYIKDVIDVPKEMARLLKEKQKLKEESMRTENKLANSNFISRAPSEIVEKEIDRLSREKTENQCLFKRTG